MARSWLWDSQISVKKTSNAWSDFICYLCCIALLPCSSSWFDLTSSNFEQFWKPDTNSSSCYANVLLLLLAKSSLVYLCVSFYHVESNSWQPLLVESHVGRRSDPECVFLLPCHLHFWNKLDLFLNHFLFYLYMMYLRFYKASSDETHLEI